MTLRAIRRHRRIYVDVNRRMYIDVCAVIDNDLEGKKKIVALGSVVFVKELRYM